MTASSHIQVSCNGAKLPTKDKTAKRITLEYRRVRSRTQNIVISLPDFVRNVFHLPPRILDLLEIAAYVFTADRLVSRGSRDSLEYHSWSRSFHFFVRVRDNHFWDQSTTKRKLSDALTFMSGDLSYDFTFQPGHSTPRTSLFDSEEFMIEPKTDTNVLLYSGGLDSLAGATERLNGTSEQICLVSHRSQPRMVRTQNQLFKALSKEYEGRLKHYKFKCTLHDLTAVEETQRTRSFLYCSIALALAHALNQSKMYVYENGITGLNFSKREDLANARASRTTHPQTLAHLAEFFSLVVGSQFEILNPFIWKTKTDIFKYLEQLESTDLISSSVSCGRGRINFKYGTHCGVCSQCIDRRLASYAAGLNEFDDDTGIYSFDFIKEPLTNSELKTSLTDYIRQARYFATWGINNFYIELLNELTQIVGHIPDLSEDEVIQGMYELCKRHGDQIENALSRIRNLHDKPFTETKSDSFLKMISDKVYLGKSFNSKSVIEELKSIEPGNSDAKKYENTMLTILKALFCPPLTDPHTQVRTSDGREIIDITFQNSAESGFWHDIKNRHNNFVIVFELKNMVDLANEEFNQISSRLDDKRGRFGVLISRDNDNLDLQRAYRKLNNQDQIILNITDREIIDMLQLIPLGDSPTDYISKIYRRFLEEA